jgi:hypothetical protein
VFLSSLEFEMIYLEAVGIETICGDGQLNKREKQERDDHCSLRSVVRNTKEAEQEIIQRERLDLPIDGEDFWQQRRSSIDENDGKSGTSMIECQCEGKSK